MLEYKVIQSRIYQTLPQTPRRAAAHLNMVFTQGRGFVVRVSFGLPRLIVSVTYSSLPRRGHRAKHFLKLGMRSQYQHAAPASESPVNDEDSLAGAAC